ncbi:MAG: C4-type zinc ribbon domain-containing protein [Actinomycetota bacterium]
MASEAYEQILHIQSLDRSIALLRHRADSHPARTAIDAVDRQLAAHDGGTTEVEERRHELGRTQKRLEDEIASIEDKRRDIDGKLYGGEITASKELLALQDEAAALLQRQTGLEDQDLEIMEQVEELESTLASLAEQRSELTGQRAIHEGELATAIDSINGEIAVIQGQRDGAASGASAELLARYEDLRDQFDGQPVARLVGANCDGCHIQLSAVVIDQIGKMPEDAVVICEECGRLLVR